MSATLLIRCMQWITRCSFSEFIHGILQGPSKQIKLFLPFLSVNGATCLLFHVYTYCSVKRWQQCTVMVCFCKNCLVHLQQIKLGWRSTSALERRLNSTTPNQRSMCTPSVTQFRTCCPVHYHYNFTTEFVCVLCTLPVCASGQLEA